jgi:hypothetical protein
MRTVLSKDVEVDYWQIYVVSGDDQPDIENSFGGQRNGLCGAAMPGYLFLVTGLHSGEVGFTVEVHDEAPPVDESWQEIVEASFRPAGEASLLGWGGEWYQPLDLAQTCYRVRYCATGMDEAYAQDTRIEDEPQFDRYLLQLWPAPPQPDTVIKQTSEIAAYWHQTARETPPPPAPEDVPEDEDAGLALADREWEEEQARRQAEDRRWGGPMPEQLRGLPGNVINVGAMDRFLVEALAQADPLTQRQIARWVTRRAFAEAGLADVGWIAPVLAAMDQGEPLPPPFDGARLPWDLLFSDEQVPSTTVTSPDGSADNYRQQAMAFPALLSAREQDPLRAALDALWAAAVAFGHERRQVLFAEVRQAFPAIASGGG